ncbi:DUF6236 family protein [Streptomyces sp. NPDC001404]|uniref:DUF6236 family protein n=1 Tax=Streptomyces sp. NPDC001404 TaxID=3364571 RepID=UPI00367BF9CB
MRTIGLYYPYFHVRDDAWLKASSLYLPQVARVRPPGYPVSDSPTAAVLRDELDFLLDVDPSPWAGATAREFEAFVDREEETLRARYQLPQRTSRNSAFMAEVGNPWHQNQRRFAWIHTSQLGIPATDWGPRGTPFTEHLCDLGLAWDTRFDPLTGVQDDGRWLGMHPRLISVYSCALAHRIAQANALAPVTEDPRLFALPSNCTVDELGNALLQGSRSASLPGSSDQVAVLYACAAVQAVVPARIAGVPVERIVRARRGLSDEFDAFRAHIDALGEEFAWLDGIEDPEILQSQLRSMIERDLTKPTRELERGLRALGMQPVRAALGLKSLELPAVAALAAQAAHLSPVAGAGGAITLQLFSAARTARRDAAEQRKSAAGYLLKLRRELDPARYRERARRALLRTLDRAYRPWW